MDKAKHQFSYFSRSIINLFRSKNIEQSNFLNQCCPEVLLDPEYSLNVQVIESNFHRFKKKDKPVLFKGAANRFPLLNYLSVDSLASICLGDIYGMSTVDKTLYSEEPVIKFFPLFQLHPELIDLINLEFFYKLAGPAPTIDQGFQLFASKIEGGITHFHNANDSNLFCQLSGRKRWIIYQSKYSHLFMPDVIDGEYRLPGNKLVNFDMFDGKVPKILENIPYFDIILDPGDILYVPPYAWHTVKNISKDSIAFGYRWLSPLECINREPIYFLLDCLALNPPIWKSIKIARRDFRNLFIHQSGKNLAYERAFCEQIKISEMRYLIYKNKIKEQKRRYSII